MLSLTNTTFGAVSRSFEVVLVCAALTNKTITKKIGCTADVITSCSVVIFDHTTSITSSCFILPLSNAHVQSHHTLNSSEMSYSAAKMKHSRQVCERIAAPYEKNNVWKPILLRPPNKSTNLKISIILPL